jgi:hypothetical protein
MEVCYWALLFMPLVILHHLLNVSVQLANIRGFKQKNLKEMSYQSVTTGERTPVFTFVRTFLVASLATFSAAHPFLSSFILWEGMSTLQTWVRLKWCQFFSSVDPWYTEQFFVISDCCNCPRHWFCQTPVHRISRSMHCVVFHLSIGSVRP